MSAWGESHPRSRETGAAMVEAAFVVIAALALFAFTLNLGIKLLTRYNLTVASREAIRVASSDPSISENSAKISGIAQAAIRFPWFYSSIVVTNTLPDAVTTVVNQFGTTCSKQVTVRISLTEHPLLRLFTIGSDQTTARTTSFRYNTQSLCS